MAVFTYSRVPAFNPNTTPVSVARSATGNVYDLGDTGFTTPLNLTLVATNTVTTTLVSDANGMFPDFTLVDRTSVVFKSGTNKMVLTTTTPIPGPPGADSTVPGPPGPATTDASLLVAGTVSDARLPARLQDAALSATYSPLTVGGKTAVRKDELVLNVKDYGAVGNGTTDDTAAIQAAINAATAGSAIFFPKTGSAAFYKVMDKLTVTTPNLRFIGQPRDGYAVSIRCAVASKTMVEVKTTGFVLEDLALFGDSSATNGAGATVIGLDLFGDTDGNIDASVRGATFQGLAIGARTRGRNAMFAADALFSNCLKGIVIDGKDGVYHTGPAADQNRGNTVRHCRFHNIGNASTDAAIEITVAAKVLHATIENNFFDSNGAGRHVVATGDATNPCKGLTVSGNKHAETQADVYALTYVNNSTVRAADIAGNAGVGGSLSNGIVAANCDTLRILDVLGLQLGKSGVVATNCANLQIRNVHFRAIGTDAGSTGHGFDIDATNTACNFDNLTVETTDGWGFTGSPATVKFGRYAFKSCTLGGINSTTIIADQVYLPAAAMGAITGAPNLAGQPGVGYPMAWQLDATTVEQVVGQMNALPNDWETFDAYIVWAATDGTAGNVIWDLNYSFIIAGQLTNNGNTANPGTAQAAPGVAGQVARYKIASGKNRSTAPMVIRVDRNAASGSDTYAADASLLGVQLVRAS